MTIHRRTSLTLAILSLAVQFAWPQAPRPNDVTHDPVTAVRLDGSSVAGTLLDITDEAVRLGGPDERGSLDVQRSELLSLEFQADDAKPAFRPILEFANGDRLHAEIGATDGDLLNVRRDEDMFAVPIEAMRGITFQSLDPDDGTGALLFRDEGADDLVLLTNGDRLAGQFVSLSESDLTIDTEGREVLVPRARIAAIAFSPELTNAPTIDGPHQIVHDASGWLTVQGLKRMDDGSWSGTTAFGAPASWPRDGIRRMQFLEGRVVPLSSLTPVNAEFTPYLDRVWPIRLNRAVTGESLTAGGVTFATGIGVHSRCRLSYDLGGAYKAFHVVGGLADSAGDVGSVEFGIELDGREVVRTGPVTRMTEPLRVVNLDVTDVRSLVLTVDYGRNGDVLDRANWCDALLVRKP